MPFIVRIPCEDFLNFKIYTFSTNNNIFQAIEALDPDHRCLEYWNHKLPMKEKLTDNTYELPVSSGNRNDTKKLKYPSESKFSGGQTTVLTNTGVSIGGQDNLIPNNTHSLNKECMTVLQGLMKSANPEELSIVQRVFCQESHSAEWKAALSVLNKDI